jgi:Thiol-disulfide isomerase and thioredoxins
MIVRVFRFFATVAILGALWGCGTGPSLALLGEEARPLKAFRGQWLFVNYWAEWCGPCLEEIPELNAFHGADNGAQVLGINFDQVGAEVMAQQASQLAIAFPLALGDPGALLGVSTPEVLPSTYVIDPEGTLRTVLVGPQDATSLAAAMANP